MGRPFGNIDTPFVGGTQLNRKFARAYSGCPGGTLFNAAQHIVHMRNRPSESIEVIPIEHRIARGYKLMSYVEGSRNQKPTEEDGELTSWKRSL